MNPEHCETWPRVLVTGASGFLGEHIVTRLLKQNRPVRALLRRPHSYPGRLPGRPLYGNSTLPLYEEAIGDLTDPSFIRQAVVGCGAVIHCAATGGSVLETVFRTNVQATTFLLDEAEKAGVQTFLHLSSTAVYARLGRAKIDEGAPLIVEGSPYELTKAEADRRVLSRAHPRLIATVLRPANILGLHPSSTWSVRIPLTIRFGRYHLQHDGEDTVAFIHVDDLTETILRALERPGVAGQAYNLADFHTTWRTYVDTVRRWFGAPIPLIVPFEQLPPGSYWKGQYDCSRAHALLDHQVTRTLDEALDETRDFWLGPGRTWLPWDPIGGTMTEE